MKQRTFQLFHGRNGAAAGDATDPHIGDIVAGSIRIDSDNPDVGDYAADGKITNAAGTIQYGTVDYTTGEVTIWDRIRADDNSFDRNVDYSYTNDNGGAVVAINDETTYESDSALRANQAYLGHGGIKPGSVSIIIEGDVSGNRQVITDRFGATDTNSPTTGLLVNESGVRVGQIAYDTGRIIIEGINTATADSDSDGDFNTGTTQVLRAALNDRLNPDKVHANYTYSEGEGRRGFVQLGNGGMFGGRGGRNTTGNFGEIIVNVAGDVRVHGGAYEQSYAQVGHGGYQNQGFHGYQTDPGNTPDTTVWGDGKITPTADMDLVGNREGNITVNSGGIVEVLAGRGLHYYAQRNYSQLGHGGWDADGHHQGNIRVNAGTGDISLAPGTIGGSGQDAGVVFTAGQTRDAYTQLGHGGFGARSARANNNNGARGLTGTIDVTSEGSIFFTSGTLMDNRYDGTGGIDWEDGRIYSQLGHGGYDTDTRHDGGDQLKQTGLGHNGDISVTSTVGSITFQAGDASVAAPGAVMVNGSYADTPGLGNNYGIIHYTQLGHGGYSSRGDHSGNITVIAAEDIKFNAGANTLDDSTDKRNYAMLGMGGDDADGYHGRRTDGLTFADEQTNLETIKVQATNGDIEFIGGPGRRNWVMLGNGGYEVGGDASANIDVDAGGHVWFIGGQGDYDKFAVKNEVGAHIDAATYSFNGAGQAYGWTPLRRQDIDISRRDFVITVDGINYIANGSSQIEADGDARRTTAWIYNENTAVFDANGKLDIAGSPAGTVVGEIDLRDGLVRFTEDIDPNDTQAFGTTYNVAGWGGGTAQNSSDQTQVINPLLAQAIQGPGLATSVGNTFSAIAYMNNTVGGITNVMEPDIAPFGDNIGIAEAGGNSFAGSLILSITDGTT
ncbi:hypothetical protein OAE56_04210, partial [Verrucomicrobiales bacterium]|nr:hypothetical protein [Verrucomicrobiales bacterium]